MDLLERYLAAVARQLPDKQKADVTAELRDELLSKAEDREAELGRPLDRADWEGLLLQIGNPVAVAGRFRRVQHLIGPEVFPYWWATLKIVLTVVAAIYFVGAMLAILGAPEVATAAVKALPDLSETLTLAFGWVTLVFVAVEHFGWARSWFQWRPKELPPAKSRGRGPFDVLAEMLMGGAVILWWIGVIQWPFTIPGIGLKVELAPVWHDWFWPILGYLVFEFVTNALTLLRPGWIVVNAVLRAARNLLGFGIAVGVLQADHWLDVVGGWPNADQADVTFHFDQGMQIGLICTAIIFLMIFLWEGWKARQDIIATRSPAVI